MKQESLNCSTIENALEQQKLFWHLMNYHYQYTISLRQKHYEHQLDQKQQLEVTNIEEDDNQKSYTLETFISELYITLTSYDIDLNQFRNFFQNLTDCLKYIEGLYRLTGGDIDLSEYDMMIAEYDKKNGVKRK